MLTRLIPGDDKHMDFAGYRDRYEAAAQRADILVHASRPLLFTRILQLLAGILHGFARFLGGFFCCIGSLFSRLTSVRSFSRICGSRGFTKW